MEFSNPAQFDRAIKRAIREFGVDPGDGYRQMLRDRFLCRVFSSGSGRFILKGGSGMIARIPDARATRDIDFATAGRENANDALSELVALASRDLGDFCSFRLTKSEESLDENGYSRLLKLRFATYVGQQEKDPVLIDLSLAQLRRAVTNECARRNEQNHGHGRADGIPNNEAFGTVAVVPFRIPATVTLIEASEVGRGKIIPTRRYVSAGRRAAQTHDPGGIVKPIAVEGFGRHLGGPDTSGPPLCIEAPGAFESSQNTAGNILVDSSRMKGVRDQAVEWELGRPRPLVKAVRRLILANKERKVVDLS